MTNEELLREIEKANRQKSIYLNFSNKGLDIIPAEIGKLTNLRRLDLSSNQLTSLPVEIKNLINLREINLNINQLASLTAEIGELSKLIRLELNNNQLTSLPVEIGNLTNLRELYLVGNQLTSLPVEIGNLTNLRELYFGDNPGLSLPIDIRGKGTSEIINFYRQQLEKEIDQIYEAKLIIIGEAGAGKTTLAKKIQSPEYQLQEENSTQGIDVIEWKFTFDNDKEFRVNIWDFGGQEIYHATHQFFLTKRSLYVLVADNRKEDTDFYYWLNVVELLSNKSPILIIKNEKQDLEKEINDLQLRREFTNLREILSTNLSTRRGLPEILRQIKHHISSLPHVGDELPKTWVKVRGALEQESRDYISLDEYFNLCQDNGFTRREDKLQLSEYLHDLGVCLHFQEDDLLIKTVIIKPTWGTDAVYKVLVNPLVINKQGRFTRDDLKKIWNEDKYATMQPELLRLMMNFKLCYEIPNSINTYIAPQLLTPNQPCYTWDKSENLLLRYEYEFMPKGILTRFIVEMHTWIEEQSFVWKSGIVLKKNGARAELIELYCYRKGEIHIRVSGNRKRDLLTTIRHEFDKIHDSYNSLLDDGLNKVQRLKYKILVPCNCFITCQNSDRPFFYPLEQLYKCLDLQKEIQCQNSLDMIDVSSLIDDITKPKTEKFIDNQSRSKQEQDRLENEWQLRHQKLTNLIKASIEEADVNRKFQLNKQIKIEEIELEKLNDKLS